MPTLNIVQRRKRSLEKYEDDDINNQEEEQKYLIDDDEILMNRLNKRSQINKKIKKTTKNPIKVNKQNTTGINTVDLLKNVDDQQESQNYFYSEKEPTKFLDSSSIPEETKNELLVEKSLFDVKNYLESIANIKKNLIKVNKTDSNNKSNFSRKLNVSLNRNISKKVQPLLNNSETTYEDQNEDKTTKIVQETTREPKQTHRNSRLRLKQKQSAKFKSRTSPRLNTTKLPRHFKTKMETKQNYFKENSYNVATTSESPIDWSVMVPNDSEKTIYESFYELLDTNRRNDVGSENKVNTDNEKSNDKSTMR
jgi:hypothetical protein